jgi:hypothetical protein
LTLITNHRYIATKYDKAENIQANSLVKKMRAWTCATTADLNVTAFAAAGYITYLIKMTNPVHLKVNLSKATYLGDLAEKFSAVSFRLSIAPPSRTRIDQSSIPFKK